jgi:hypothetical protein
VRAYVILTGAIFGLLALVHVWRMVVEPHLRSDPWYILITAVAAILSLAAWLVSRRVGRS